MRYDRELLQQVMERDGCIIDDSVFEGKLNREVRIDLHTIVESVD